MIKNKIIIIILLLFSCSSIREIKEKDKSFTSYKLRYVNLNLIFDYMINNDANARNLKLQKDGILLKMNSLPGMQAAASSEAEKKELSEKQIELKQELDLKRKDEDNFKNKTLNTINTALENIAKVSDVDFIFNVGEGAVYVKKEYDITEEVLREIIRLKERSSPVTR